MSMTFTGGCLCGAIRYSIDYPNDKLPPSNLTTQNGTCQCTMCRKFTGSLLPQSLTVQRSWITPDITTLPTFKTYLSSANGERSFCSTCGSSLTFNYRRDDGEIEFYLGTLDEEVLAGKIVGEKTDENGPHFEREKALGSQVGKAATHIFYENAVPDVTDNLQGKKFWRDRASGKPFE
ncbi:hypothetical protein EJ06DRAFT_545433 [Trichodelitschia bisporula]|uniref:CENP-V/GFA domain-containing protein n=1 Tax=Trichodelitschia bisporula TaxID=703511 RepID=A0A6G1HIJ1_9PEZI|nr:hypothetical protein EJ06DRAFT_545433 [Trichodelitschia bisporula]